MPDPPEHLLSRFSPDIGWKPTSPIDHLPKPMLDPSLPPHGRHAARKHSTLSAAPVRRACTRRPTCLIRCSRQACPGPNSHPRVLTRVIERVAPGARPARSNDEAARAACRPGHRGRFPRVLREEPPGSSTPEVLSIDGSPLLQPNSEACAPRQTTSGHVRLTPYVTTGEALSTVCHQPVENARRLLRPSSRTRTLTGPRRGERSLHACSGESRSPARHMWR